MKLAVAIREVGKHVETEPVADGLVESAEDARFVGIAGVALQQLFRFFAAIAAEMRVQQINHGPKVPAFFDVHLKNIAQIVQRRRGMAEQPLLLYGSGLGVALRDN